MTTDHGSVRVGNTDIEYRVRRSDRRRKTVQIAVDGTGVQVAAPHDTSDDDIRGIVRRRAPWILANVPDSLLEVPKKRFVSGETLPYLGKNVRMLVKAKDVRSVEVRFDHWNLQITVPQGLAEDVRSERIRKAIVAWYRHRAELRVKRCLQQWWPRLGAGALPAILIRDQRQRWGSCAPDGTLRFNWRVAMLKPDLAEYVVIHELTHLKVRHHSAEFWDLLSKTTPDAQQRRRRLREEGKFLSL